jgi:integrase
MDQYNFRSRVFYPALRRAKLRRVRVHDLRHGAASMMIAAGCDIASVSRQLGHANVAVTLGVYSHWFQKRTESGLGAMRSVPRKRRWWWNGCRASARVTYHG